MIVVQCHCCGGSGAKRQEYVGERGPFTRPRPCRFCRGTGRVVVEFRYHYALTIGTGVLQPDGHGPDETRQRCAEGPTDYDRTEDVPVDDTAVTISGHFVGYEPMTPAELRAAIAEELQAAAVESAVGFSG